MKNKKPFGLFLDKDELDLLRSLFEDYKDLNGQMQFSLGFSMLETKIAAILKQRPVSGGL